MDITRMRTDAVRVMNGVVPLKWSKVQLEQSAYPVCSVVVEDESLSDALVIMLGETLLFTGSVRKRSARGKGQYLLEAHTDAHKVSMRLKAMSWNNATVHSIVQDIATAVNVKVNIAGLPMVLLKRFSVGRGDMLGTALTQVLRALKPHEPQAMEWLWDAQNVLHIGVSVRLPKKTVRVAKDEVLDVDVHGVKVLPTKVFAYRDVVAVETDAGVHLYTVENAQYVFDPSRGSNVHISGTRGEGLMANLSVDAVLARENNPGSSAAFGPSKAFVGVGGAGVFASGAGSLKGTQQKYVSMPERRSYTISQSFIDTDKDREKDKSKPPRSETTRPGDRRLDTRAIVVHYTAVAGGLVKGIRNYFDRGEVAASAHYAVDWTGSILEIIPHHEVAWHCGVDVNKGGTYTDFGKELMKNYENPNKSYVSPNYITVGVEMCIESNWNAKNKDGVFAYKTLEATAYLVAALLKEYGLSTALNGLKSVLSDRRVKDDKAVLKLDDVKTLKVLTTHFGITGKLCPRPFLSESSTRNFVYNEKWSEFVTMVVEYCRQDVTL